MYFSAVKRVKHDRILGLDPGTNILGYAIIDRYDQELRLIQMGVLNLSKLDNHQDKLKEIFLQLQEIIETYLPGIMAIEAPFYGKNVQSMLKLGRAQGVAMAAGMTMGLAIQEFSPKKIKQSVTGNGNASKEQVAAMLSHILKRPIQNEALDATDALAAAICYHQQNSGNQFQEANGSYRDWSAYIKDNPHKKRS